MALDHWMAAHMLMDIPLGPVCRSRAGPLYSAGEYCGMIPVSVQGIPAGRWIVLKPYKYIYILYLSIYALSLHIGCVRKLGQLTCCLSGNDYQGMTLQAAFVEAGF